MEQRPPATRQNHSTRWQLSRSAGKIGKESFANRSVKVNAQSPGSDIFIDGENDFCSFHHFFCRSYSGVWDAWKQSKWNLSSGELPATLCKQYARACTFSTGVSQ